MYLLKQWRESRIISTLAALALILLLLLVLKGSVAIDTFHSHGNNDNQGFAFIFVPIFYVEAALVAFWGWLAGGIGAGKNLGEDSGSFLFTRPRRRAWFLWSDWGYAMAQIAAIILLMNIMIGFLIAHALVLMHSPGVVQLTTQGQPVPLTFIMFTISVGVLLFAGLIYGLSYFSTILIKRTSGVMLAAGILVAYLILLGILHHYYPAFHTPGLIMNVFNFDQHSMYGLSGNLAYNFAARTVAMLAFPAAAQLILDHSEI
jgi:hypothetical protein